MTWPFGDDVRIVVVRELARQEVLLEPTRVGHRKQLHPGLRLDRAYRAERLYARACRRRDLAALHGLESVGLAHVDFLDRQLEDLLEHDLHAELGSAAGVAEVDLLALQVVEAVDVLGDHQMQLVLKQRRDVGDALVDVGAELARFLEIADDMRMHDPHIDALEIEHVLDVLGAALADDRQHAQLTPPGRFAAVEHRRHVVGGVKEAAVGVARDDGDRVGVQGAGQRRVTRDPVLAISGLSEPDLSGGGVLRQSS